MANPVYGHGRGRLGSALILALCLCASGVAHGAAPQWRVTVTEDSNLVRGLELEVVDQGFIHHMFLLMDPHDDKIDKVAYSMRRAVDFSAPPVSPGAFMMAVEKGAHVVVNHQTRPLTSLRDYTTCVQSYEGVTFDEALLKRVKGALGALEASPLERTPEAVARLGKNKAFQELRGVVTAQMKRLRPVAERAWGAFSFADCEDPAKLTAVLKGSGEVKEVEQDDAERIEVEDRDEDLVPPAYLHEYVRWRSPALKRGEYVFRVDTLGLAGPIGSIKNVSTYGGARPFRWADGSKERVGTADVFHVEMKIPIVSWFMDIVMTYRMNAGSAAPVILGMDYSIPGSPRLVSWPLGGQNAIQRR